MFGPVITTETHPAFSGARTHSNNSAEMSAMIEALSFLGPRVRLPVMWNRVFIMTLNTLLVCAWARSKPAPTFSWRSHVNGPCYAPNTSYGSPCNTCTVTLGIWVMNVLTMLRRLVHLVSSPATTLPPAGFVITLTHLSVVMAVTTSARFWKDCNTLEQMQRRYLKMGVSAVFTIGFLCSSRAFLCHR